MDQENSDSGRGAVGTADTAPAGPPAPGAAPADPLDDLEQQIQALAAEISTLDAEITKKQGTLTSTQSDLDKRRAHKQALDKRRTDLQRLVDAARDQRQKLGQQRKDATTEGEAARQWLAQVHADLEQQLAKDLRSQIDKAINTVNQAAAALDKDRAAKQKEVADAEADLAAKKATAQKADGERVQAQAALSRLAGEIKDALSWVKRAQAALKKAYDAGQSREAYLLADDLNRALQKLDGLRDPARETALAQQVEDAWMAAQQAADAVAPAEDVVNQRRSELAAIDKKAQEYRDKRRQKIEDLLAAQPAPAPSTYQEPPTTNGGAAGA